MSAPFPIQGVVGILAEGCPAGDRKLEPALGPGLAGIEMRADLLLGQGRGWTPDALSSRLRRLKASGAPVLFTVRLPSHGGSFQGSEPERLRLYRLAIEAGAAAVDAEWGTEAARVLAREQAPLIVSAHFFDRMLSPAELDGLGERMAAGSPLAIKIVPTAQRLMDSVHMLRWLEKAPPQGPRRIGFAMGDRGVLSRLLALAWGSAITYGTFGAPVAAGQLRVEELLEVYRVKELKRSSRLFGVAGGRALLSYSPYLHNPAFRRRGLDAGYLPLQAGAFSEVVEVLEPLQIEGLSVTIPFKEAAFRLAARADARSRACGASNTLIIQRASDERTIHGHNTDFDGILLPLRRRLPDLRGVSVGVIGNGGAARGAVRALIEAGASPTLYFRNIERGRPVAEALGIPGHLIGDIRAGNHRVFINATPVGSQAGDPSPVPKEIFQGSAANPRLAFEMVYEPAETRFLLDAREMGAEEISGREMLVAQGVAQFQLFTGATATEEEFSDHYRRGHALRHGG
ncbi:MAG: type I 3-dehydroquinate dehydratase [Planctomycetes bacterium]|nr:type I 3-dehydroquinate dehydratase [Planctomycetota bacterium]